MREARTHLEAALRDGERSIQVLASSFQALAQDCEELLGVTRELVGATQTSGASEVLPFLRRIYDDCERVLHLRLEAAAGVSDLLAGEQELLEHLERPARAQQSTARTARILAVMLRIEIARLGPAGEAFSYMSGELEQASIAISKSVDELDNLIRARHESTPGRRRSIEEARTQARRNLAKIAGDRESALPQMDRASADLEQMPVAFEGCVQEVSGQIARVTAAVQLQDLTRQQTEHIVKALEIAAGKGPEEAPPAAQMPLLLQVQHEQLENVCSTTRGWIEEIDECLQTILRLGDSELQAMLEQIVCLENLLTTQGRWMTQFESEFSHYDKVNEQELAEFEAIMQVVRKHLRQSQKTSEHLELLNLNSMVAAHNVGSQASSVLQITNSISRLATDWRGLTMSSAESMESMIEAATKRGQQTREVAVSTKSAIAEIRSESGATLELLHTISEVSHRCKDEGRRVVQRMHQRMQQVRSAIEELRKVLGEFESARDSVREAVTESGDLSPREAARSDLQAVESVLAGSYTSEIERHVLRKVLFGEMPPALSAGSGDGGLELF